MTYWARRVGAILLIAGAARVFAAGVVRAPQPVPGEYIIQFAHDARSSAALGQTLVREVGGKVLTDLSIVKAIGVRMTPEQAAAAARHPLVAVVEENFVLQTAVEVQVDTTVQIVDNTAHPNAPNRWGLDRIDQYGPNHPRFSNSYSWCASGSGVRIYVIDGGVLPTHPDLVGRVDSGSTLDSYMVNAGFASLGPACWLQTQSGFPTYEQVRFRSDSGHGTAVASIAAGTKYGVARTATVVDARAMNCDGSSTALRLIKTLDWITTADPNRGSGPKVINMSFTGLSTMADASAFTAAIANTVDGYGIPIVVAAGNNNANTSGYLPASAPRAIAIGGMNKASDTRWASSNYGSAVAFYAAAQFVESASMKVRAVDPTLPRDYVRSELTDNSRCPDTCVSGTSFAAPHAAGVIARYIERNPTAGRNAIIAALQQQNVTYSGGLQVSQPDGSTRPVLVYYQCP